MQSILERLQIKAVNAGASTGADGWIEDADGAELVSINPTTGKPIGSVRQASVESYDRGHGQVAGRLSRPGARRPRPSVA